MAAADPPVPLEAVPASSEGDVDTMLPQWAALETQSDSGSEGYADAVADLFQESAVAGDADFALPSRVKKRPAPPVPQVFRVSVQIDKFHLSLLNTLGLWSNPIVELLLTDTMVDYLVGADSHSSMGLNSSIMLTQWNPIAKVSSFSMNHCSRISNSYFQQALEPLLESWTFRFEASRTFALMLIQSRDILNLNLSASQLKGTISTLKRIQADWADLVAVNSAESDALHEHQPALALEAPTNKLAEASSKQLRTSPHTIVNATGTRLHVWFQLPYRGDALTTSPFIIESGAEHCVDSASLCPSYDSFVAPEIDGEPLSPYPCRLTLPGVSTLIFGSGADVCPTAIAHTELNSGATVTTVSSGYVVRNNTALELHISASGKGTFQPLLPGQSW